MALRWSFNTPFHTADAAQRSRRRRAMSDAAGNTIFVYESGSTYTGGIELENTQLLIGESVGLGVVNGMTIGGSGSNPTIATGAAANDVTLASGNTVRGFTLGNSSGSALAGTSFGTLTIDTVTINSSGQALNLNTGAFGAGAAFTSITSTGGTNGISLTSVTGTVDLGSGALQRRQRHGVPRQRRHGFEYLQRQDQQEQRRLPDRHRQSRSGTMTFQTGTLSSTGTSSGLRVQNSNGGTINFNNPTKTLNTGANTCGHAEHEQRGRDDELRRRRAGHRHDQRHRVQRDRRRHDQRDGHEQLHHHHVWRGDQRRQHDDRR